MKFADFPQAVVNENVEYAVKEITNVIKKYGPRESGGENCYAAQKHIKKELDSFCDETHFESYKMSPKALVHFTKIVSAAIIIAVALCSILTFKGIMTFFLSQCIVAGVIAVSLFVTLMQFVLYKEFLDPLYKKVEAHNLIGVRKPRGEVKRRIIISGHIDAAYEWRHIYFGKDSPLMLGLMYGTIGGAVISLILAVITIVANFVDMGKFGDFMLNYSFYFNFFTALMMITLFLFVDFKTISPGANDNLTGTYAAVTALRMLDMAGVDFENTEVCAMITDGEEAGLRGCKAWARDHYDEYVNGGVETAILCVDTLTDYEYMNVYKKDMSGMVDNSKALSELVMEAGKEAGCDDIKLATVFFGSSDAAAFSQAGITATTLAAMDPHPADYYHNRRDTADRLVPKTIKAGFNTVIATILKFDEQGLQK